MTRDDHQDESARLDEEAERLLKDWPAPERSALELEETANRIVERARAEGLNATDAALLEPPLPRTEDEPAGLEEEEARQAAPADDAPSLAEIARATVGRERDGLAEMAREGFALAAQTRAQQPFARRTPTPGQPAAAAAARLQEPVRGGAASERRQPRPADPAVRRAPTVFVAAASALAAAAVVALYFVSQRAEPPVVPLPAPAPAEVAEAKPGGEEPAPAVEEEKQAAPLASGAVALDDLPSEERSPAKGVPRAKPAPQAAPKAAQGEKSGRPADRATEGSGAPPLPPMRPAAQEADLPDKPSVGAVQAAVASVAPSARACLAGLTEGAKASLTFGSDGRIQSIGLSGGDLGSVGETCIRNALSGARVAPFARPSYTVSTTIRPP